MVPLEISYLTFAESFNGFGIDDSATASGSTPYYQTPPPLQHFFASLHLVMNLETARSLTDTLAFPDIGKLSDFSHGRCGGICG